MQRLQPFADTDSLSRFVEHVSSYVRAVVTEVEHREQNVVLDVAEYDALRRENSAVRCCLVLIGCALGMDLPDVAFEDPAFQRMHFAAVDMISWSNVSMILPSPLDWGKHSFRRLLAGCLLVQERASNGADHEQCPYSLTTQR